MGDVLVTDGANAVLSYGFEPSDNVATVLNRSIRNKGVTGFLAERVAEPNENFDSTGEPLVGSVQKVDFKSKIELNPDVDTLAPLIAHHGGFYAFAAALAVDVNPLTVRARVPGDAANAKRVDSFALELDPGNGKALLGTGCRVTDFEEKIAASKIVSQSLSIMGCYDTRMGVSQLAIAGTYLGTPIFLGMWGEDAVAPLAIKVTAVAGPGFVGKVKVVSGVDPYTGPEITVYAFDEIFPLGRSLPGNKMQGVQRGNDVYCVFPAAAGALALDQAWTVVNTRTPAIPSYSQRSILGAAAIEFEVNGKLFAYQSLDTKRSRAREQYFTGGSVYARTILEAQSGNAKWGLQLDVTRFDEDDTFLEHLVQAKTIACQVKRYGLPYAATGYEEFWGSVYDACEVTKVTRDNDKAKSLIQKVTLMPRRKAGAAWVDTFHTSLSAM